MKKILVSMAISALVAFPITAQKKALRALQLAVRVEAALQAVLLVQVQVPVLLVLPLVELLQQPLRLLPQS